MAQGNCRPSSSRRSIALAVERRRLLRSGMTFIILLAMVLGGSGCNVVGALLYKTSGPAAIPPQYVLAKEPTLVLVENFRNPAAVRLDADRLARYVADELKRHDIAPTVDHAALERVRAQPDYAKMTQGEIARAVGAKQIIYIDLKKFEVEDAMASEMIRGNVELTIRVVDESGKLLWPTDMPEGKLTSIETPYMRVGAGTGRTGGGPGANEIGLRESMTSQMALRIGRMFRKWKPDTEAEGAAG